MGPPWGTDLTTSRTMSSFQGEGEERLRGSEAEKHNKLI